MANGHDASVAVQLQDIQEQQDLTVVVDEGDASRPNGHTDGAKSVPLPTTEVVPKVADKGKEAAKKIDWEIPRKTLHSSIGSYRRDSRPCAHVDNARHSQVLEPSPSTLVIILYHLSYMGS